MQEFRLRAALSTVRPERSRRAFLIGQAQVRASTRLAPTSVLTIAPTWQPTLYA
jgi:hypothetical protein